MKYGIDVAKWNGVIDWSKVKLANISFAVLKVTNKNNRVEEAFERNYAGATEQGITVGVYRYVYAKTVEAAKAEANAIVQALSGKKINFRVWLDMEADSIKNIGKSRLTEIINAEADIIMCILPPIGVAMLGIDYYTGSLWTYDKVTARLYEDKYGQNTEVHIRNSMSLSPAAKRFITDNFEKLKEEAFSGRMQISSERIRTLSSLTSLTPERLTGMISEAPDAAALISYIEKYGK